MEGMMVKINCAAIPQTEARLLAMTFLDGVRKFYSDPKNVEKFQEWQKRKQAESLVSA